MPSFRNLPVELRKKIFALGFTPQGTTQIEAYLRPAAVPRVHPGIHPREVALVSRNLRRNKGASTPRPSYNLALLKVDRETYREALPVLYESLELKFANFRALELFLDQIGDAKQHLRHVEIAPKGYESDFGPLYGATKRSFAMLESATGLQSFKVSHFDFCCAFIDQVGHDVALANLANSCACLLLALQHARETKDLTADTQEMMDIFEIVLPKCHGCAHCDKRGRQRVSTRLCILVKLERGEKYLRCRCPCAVAVNMNQEMMGHFKRMLEHKLEDK